MPMHCRVSSTDGCDVCGLSAGAFFGLMAAPIAVPIGVIVAGELTGGDGSWFWTLVGAAVPWVAGYVGMRLLAPDYEPNDKALLVLVAGATALELTGSIFAYRTSVDVRPALSLSEHGVHAGITLRAQL